jgi:hypothetical protein
VITVARVAVPGVDVVVPVPVGLAGHIAPVPPLPVVAQGQLRFGYLAPIVAFDVHRSAPLRATATP